MKAVDKSQRPWGTCVFEIHLYTVWRSNHIGLMFQQPRAHASAMTCVTSPSSALIYSQDICWQFLYFSLKRNVLMPYLPNRTISSMRTGMEFGKQPALPDSTPPTNTGAKVTLQIWLPSPCLTSWLPAVGCGVWDARVLPLQQHSPGQRAAQEPYTAGMTLYSQGLFCSNSLSKNMGGVLRAYKLCWRAFTQDDCRGGQHLP